MGQLCCFPFSQAEEKIGKWPIGQTNHADLLASLQGDTGRCACVCVGVCASMRAHRFSCQPPAFMQTCRWGGWGGRSACRRVCGRSLPPWLRKTCPPAGEPNPLFNGCV